jgi:hypothetical protein
VCMWCVCGVCVYVCTIQKVLLRNQMQADKLGGAWNTNWRYDESIQILGWKGMKGRKLLESVGVNERIQKSGWNKKDWVCNRFITDDIGQRYAVVNTAIYCQCPKKMGISWVAGQLLASQRVLWTMKFAKCNNKNYKFWKSAINLKCSSSYFCELVRFLGRRRSALTDCHFQVLLLNRFYTVSFDPQCVLQKVHRLLQSEFSTEYDIALPLSTSRIFSFP